jgi:hypothetical protein
MYGDTCTLAVEPGLRQSYQRQSDIRERAPSFPPPFYSHSWHSNMLPPTSYRCTVFQNINTRVSGPLAEGGGGWCRSLKRALPLHHEKCTPYVTRWSSLTAKTLFVELQIWIIYDEDSGAGRGETENKGIVKTRNAWENTAKKDYRWRNKWRQKETNFHE